jgi:hypothetical protein
MLILCICLTVLLCCALAACSYLYASLKAQRALTADRESEIAWHIERANDDLAQLRKDGEAQIARLADASEKALGILRSDRDAEIVRAREEAQNWQAKATALLDKVLQRNGVAPINTPDEQPGPVRSFIPASPWEQEWEEQEREEEERARGYALKVADLTDERKAELRRRAVEAGRR